MALLSAIDINKSYGVNTILSHVSFHVNKGDRVGIVGDNGAGKTTLLSILSGQLPFDGGELSLSGEVTLGLLKQRDHFRSDKTVYQEMCSIFSEVIRIEEDLEALTHRISSVPPAESHRISGLLRQYDELTEAMKRNNGYGFRSEIRGVLSSMAFPEEYYDKSVEELSGGERTRLALAALLLRKPDLLLLDEPTNHLDIGTLKWLEQYLKNYSGTILLISHDRYFLDQVVDRIFEIENHELTEYNGNYSSYLEQKRKRREEAGRRYLHEKQEMERQEEMIRRFKQHGTEKLAKRARSREKLLSHQEKPVQPTGEKDLIRIQFKQNFQSGTDVLYAEELAKSFQGDQGKRLLFENVSFDIKRGERICMVGQNGIGKTTLLRIIMGQLSADSGHLKLGHQVVPAYYDQEQKLLSGNNTVLEELHSSYRLYTETELRSILGRFLFRKDDVFKKVSDLSGGEKAKLSLLKLMLTGANLLIMDEPTNHLDLAAKEVFEDALLSFPGTLMLVSHDRYLLNKVPTRILELRENGIESFLGGYDYYTEKKLSIASGKGYLKDLSQKVDTPKTIGMESESPDVTGLKEQRQLERRKNKELEGENRRRKRDIDTLESSIADFEAEIQRLLEEIDKEEVARDPRALLACSQQLEQAKTGLEDCYSRWMELQET